MLKKIYASLLSTFSQDDPPELACWELEPESELELELEPELLLSRSTIRGSLDSWNVKITQFTWDIEDGARGEIAPLLFGGIAVISKVRS